jgi:hypothetical protein
MPGEVPGSLREGTKRPRHPQRTGDVLRFGRPSGCTGPVSSRRRREQPLPDIGPRGRAVAGGLLARVSELEFCEHDPGGFALWISIRPGMLLCGFCYQAAQVLAKISGARPAAHRPGTPTPTRSWSSR